MKRFYMTPIELYRKLNKLENTKEILCLTGENIKAFKNEPIEFECSEIDEHSSVEEILEFIDMFFRNACFNHLQDLGKENTKCCASGCSPKVFRRQYGLPEPFEEDKVRYHAPEYVKNIEELKECIENIQKEVVKIENGYSYLRKNWMLRHEYGCLNTNEEEKWLSLKCLEYINDVADALFESEWSFMSVTRNMDYTPFIEIDKKIENNKDGE